MDEDIRNLEPNPDSKIEQSLNDNEESDIFLDPEDEKQDKEVPGTKKPIRKAPTKKKKYQSISNELRMQLIDAVENKGEKIKHVANKMGINYSSAKSICQVYKREGRSSKKTFKKRAGKEYFDIPEDIQKSMGLDTPNDPASQGQVLQTALSEKKKSSSSNENDPFLMKLKERLIESKNTSFNPAPNQSTPSNSNNTEKMTKEEENSFFNQQQTNLKPSKLENASPFQVIQPTMQNSQCFAPNIYPKQPYQQIIFIPQGNNFMMNQNFQGQMNLNTQQQGSSQTININQPTAKSISIQNIPVSDNVSFYNNPQTLNYNDINYTHQSQPQIQYIIPNAMPQQPQQLAGYPYYQPVVYYVVQPTNPLYMPTQYIPPSMDYGLPAQNFQNISSLFDNQTQMNKIQVINPNFRQQYAEINNNPQNNANTMNEWEKSGS